MKHIWIWIVIGVLSFGRIACAKGEKPEQLYAQSAVLIDADSGRVLFEKNGSEQRAMASTTKIMTCIVALERGNLEDVITVSEKAVRQPRVHLGMQTGESFYLRDLLYSLMLESHNDSAVAIAEGVGGSVEVFVGWMNEKAKQLGCEHTYFITPNGLDACDIHGKHATTALELARIMKYCIMESPQRETFLDITRTKTYTFSDVKGTRNFSCYNHNAFLEMMDGALSGKTGFTGDAGYCYVGALKRDERTLIVALLGCGWPNNRNYKWKDTRALMEYGLSHFQYRNIYEPQILPTKEVENGIPNRGSLFVTAKVELKELPPKSFTTYLLGEEEDVNVTVSLKKDWVAPLKKGEQVGTISYECHGEKLLSYPVVVKENVRKKTFGWQFFTIARYYVKINQ